ncbi:TMEM19 [Cordylochernes scorpioides]|uniref:Transmembrane protein 19 n=1 Tax=Cordylochernes scorpioides TaxID=51811 RepID=A0ABY6LK72_9ARAC|nr:TMEM19 [Cordylochernes scorpioides]
MWVISLPQFIHNARQFYDHYHRSGSTILCGVVGGQRTWVQVFCNGGVAAGWALGYLALRGPGERPVDFSTDPLGSWLVLAVLSSVASACGDTWASELGSVASPAAPRLLTTLEPVPRGTNGGVSLAGLAFSALGGLTVGASHYAVLCLAGVAPASQCWLVGMGTLAGLLGSLVDSLLGATLQFSGVETKTGRVVDRPGPGVRWVCGRALLDNHAVNLVSSAITSVLVPCLAASFYS